jgi:hypothetical protein
MGLKRSPARLQRSASGGVLMTAAERFLRRQTMSAAYLWREPGLVGYYERRAYKVVDVPTGGYKEVRFMGKSL